MKRTHASLHPYSIYILNANKAYTTVFGSISKDVRQKLGYLFWAGISLEAYSHWAGQYKISIDEMKTFLDWLEMNSSEGGCLRVAEYPQNYDADWEDLVKRR